MVAPSTWIAPSTPNLPRSTSRPAPIAIGTGRTLFAPTAVVPTASVPRHERSSAAGSAAAAGAAAAPRNATASAARSARHQRRRCQSALPDAGRVDQRFVVEQRRDTISGGAGAGAQDVSPASATQVPSVTAAAVPSNGVTVPRNAPSARTRLRFHRRSRSRSRQPASDEPSPARQLPALPASVTPTYRRLGGGAALRLRGAGRRCRMRRRTPRRSDGLRQPAPLAGAKMRFAHRRECAPVRCVACHVPKSMRSSVSWRVRIRARRPNARTTAPSPNAVAIQQHRERCCAVRSRASRPARTPIPPAELAIAVRRQGATPPVPPRPTRRCVFPGPSASRSNRSSATSTPQFRRRSVASATGARRTPEVAQARRPDSGWRPGHWLRARRLRSPSSTSRTSGRPPVCPTLPRDASGRSGLRAPVPQPSPPAAARAPSRKQPAGRRSGTPASAIVFSCQPDTARPAPSPARSQPGVPDDLEAQKLRLDDRARANVSRPPVCQGQDAELDTAIEGPLPHWSSQVAESQSSRHSREQCTRQVEPA